jgi:aminopeptidase YwaD
MGGKFAVLALALALCLPATAFAEPRPGDRPPLITTAEAEALAAELSGGNAKRTIVSLSTHHRMRGSEGYRAAAELIRDRLREYGLKEVEIISLPADGTIFYGTQRSRPAWNASFAELWERRRAGGRWVDGERIASWADMPISLAQDSVSGRADADLVDVGAGTAEGDYAGKDVRGKLVLVSAQPGEAAPLAIGKYGARTRSRPGGARIATSSAGAISTHGRIRPSPSWSRPPEPRAGSGGWPRVRACVFGPRSTPGEAPAPI